MYVDVSGNSIPNICTSVGAEALTGNIGGLGERVLARTPRPGNRFGSVVRATRGFLSYVLSE